MPLFVYWIEFDYFYYSFCFCCMYLLIFNPDTGFNLVNFSVPQKYHHLLANSLCLRNDQETAATATKTEKRITFISFIYRRVY